MSFHTINDVEYHIYQKPYYNNGEKKLPFHGDTKMMKVLCDQLDKSEVFIETGSFMGKTIYFVGKNYSNIQCYSCEIEERSFLAAKDAIHTLPNVCLELTPSPYFLYAIPFEFDSTIYDKKILFWLDAHWKTDPLYSEIKFITKHFKNFCIFIDDFEIPDDKGFWTDGYNIEKITPYIQNKENLKFYFPNYPSTDDACKHNPCGYIIITNMEINTHDNIKEITI